MSASQRRKGAAYEREICTLLATALLREVKRNIGQARDGGDDITIPPYRIECKRRAKIATYEFIRQAEAACREGEIPVVVMRADAEASLVVMRLADFIPLFAGQLNAATQ